VKSGHLSVLRKRSIPKREQYKNTYFLFWVTKHAVIKTKWRRSVLHCCSHLNETYRKFEVACFGNFNHFGIFLFSCHKTACAIGGQEKLAQYFPTFGIFSLGRAEGKPFLPSLRSGRKVVPSSRPSENPSLGKY